MDVKCLKIVSRWCDFPRLGYLRVSGLTTLNPCLKVPSVGH